MNRRSFLAAVGAALLAGPRAIAALIERHRKPRWVLRRPWLTPAEVREMWEVHEAEMAGVRDAFYAQYTMYDSMAAITRTPLPRGSFHEFERRVRAMGLL